MYYELFSRNCSNYSIIGSIHFFLSINFYELFLSVKYTIVKFYIFFYILYLFSRYLYKNRIKEIDSDALHPLENLEQLYLHFNKIESLPKGVFRSLKKLNRLFLHNNKLQRIPSEAFQNLHEIKRLRLDSNALICDCQLIWLAKMLQDKRQETQSAVTCHDPAPMQGKPVTHLLEDEGFHCRKPELTEEPTDVEITFGKTVYLSCKAVGDPLPDIVWLHNNHEMDFDDPRLQILENGTLIIENASSNDFGSYECMAKSPLGEVKSRTVRMSPPQEIHHNSRRRVTGRPRFLYTPKDVSVNLGEIAIFRCEISGQPIPTVTWYFNEQQLATTERIEIRADGNLEIRDVIIEDSGSYRCTGVNTYGRASSVARLIVNAAPTFLEPPGTQSVREEATVEFNCFVEGQPLPRITWVKDGLALSDHPRISLIVGGTKLRISQVQLSDRGRYKCLAQNIAGAISSEASLFVYSTSEPKKAPTILKRPNQIETSRQGQELELICEAEGLPNPTLVWRKDEITLGSTPHERLVTGGYLKFLNLSRTDEGIYECMAINEIGHQIVETQVILSDVPHGPAYTGISFIENAVNEARQSVSRAVEDSIQIVYNKLENNTSRRGSHGDNLRANRFPNANARAIAFSAEVYDTAVNNVLNHIKRVGNISFSTTGFNYIESLTGRDLELLANLSGCSSHRSQPDCSEWCFHSKYRTIDGTCNNMAKPLWGSSYTAFKRLLPNAYEDGFNQPVGWTKDRLYHGFPKPNARLISTQVITTEKITEDEIFTHMLMQWGQFIDHDLDLAVPGIAFESFSNRIDCRSSCEKSNPCFPIEISPDDPRIKSVRCMEFTRNSAVCGSGETSAVYAKLLPREQINQLTSFIDGSMVYGSTEEESQAIRDTSSDRGLLRSGLIGAGGKPFLPFATASHHVDCKRDRRESNLNCFLAGDIRANEQTGLLAMHTLWFREHNRIATELRQINPQWDGETIYHESRKIVGGMLQHITYAHWLPHIVGKEGMDLIGEYKGYSPKVDPSISNVFATSALRMGHGLINPVLKRLNSSFLPIAEGNLPLHKAFFSPWRIVEEGGIDPILRGLIASPAKLRLSDELLNSDLTEQLFRPAHLVALDLAALNIQRGREHGLPSYNEWRKYCGLPKAEDFHELRNEIKSQSLRNKLQQLYGHPGNIDIWVGGMAEDPIEGAKVGPTFRCLLVDQFKRLRDGDRFWYENPGVFKPDQLVQIKQATLSKVICDSGDDIAEMVENAFLLTKDGELSPLLRCNLIPEIDLRFWTECCKDCENSGKFDAIYRHQSRSRRSLPTDIGDSSELTRISHQNFTESQSSASSIQQRVTINSEKIDDVIDINEERIEGLEAVIEHMQSLIRKLHKKVHSLEAKCSKSVEKKCRDHAGNFRNSGDRWENGNCEDCICEDGNIQCFEIKCPDATCSKPIKLQGNCCPLCV
ncbi:peroxidasin-like isoform X2 [Artemia franciscana]|uniref:peroxidasin-like isoform X2 n=1 Tax=Artemia franciscana TaxID=6661 RepID=UPI0032DAD366